MKKMALVWYLINCLMVGNKVEASIYIDMPGNFTCLDRNDTNAKKKFVILCFRLSPPYDTEIADLNKLAYEYKKYVSAVVIKDEDLNKYKELFTKKEYVSLQEFILNKNTYQKNATSFPVILILDKEGKITNAWSGDRTDDGLKREDFYIKIKAGLEAISKE